MKPPSFQLIIFKFLFVTKLLVAFSLPGSAQSDSSLPDQKKSKQEIKKSYRRNDLKINLSSLTVNNYSLWYERCLTRKISFQAGYRFMPNTVLGQTTVVKKIIDIVGDEDSEVKDDLIQINASNKTITAEFRFYGGKKPGARGFYLSLYGRYMNLKSGYAYDYETSTKNYIIPLKADLKGIGGGLMIGAQWLIAKRVVLEWYILGGHYGKLTGDINGITDLSSMSESDKENLQDDIESLIGEEGKKYFKASVTNQGVFTTIDGPFIGLRGLGLSVGIGF